VLKVITIKVDSADDGSMMDGRSPCRCCTSCERFPQCTVPARRQSLGRRDPDDVTAPEASG
jgi:hypothetical protein